MTTTTQVALLRGINVGKSKRIAMGRLRELLDAVIEGNPMPEHTDQAAKLLVAFLSAAPKPDRIKTLDPAEFAPDEIHFSGREAYLYHPNGVIAAKIGPTFWEKHLGVSATTRNWTTVTKLASLAA